jgi:hypothetical protein
LFEGLICLFSANQAASLCVALSPSLFVSVPWTVNILINLRNGKETQKKISLSALRDMNERNIIIVVLGTFCDNLSHQSCSNVFMEIFVSCSRDGEKELFFIKISQEIDFSTAQNGIFIEVGRIQINFHIIT